jgi:hypothetical protein
MEFISAPLITPQRLCGVAFIAALVAVAIYGMLKKDRAYYKVFLILNPICTLFVLFYLLPHEYTKMEANPLKFLSQIYGEKNTNVVLLIFAEYLIVNLSIASWICVKRANTKRAAKFVEVPLIKKGVSSDDDRPYRQMSINSYL